MTRKSDCSGYDDLLHTLLRSICARSLEFTGPGVAYARVFLDQVPFFSPGTVELLHTYLKLTGPGAAYARTLLEDQVPSVDIGISRLLHGETVRE